MTDARPEPDETEDKAERTAAEPTMTAATGPAGAESAGAESAPVVAGHASAEGARTFDPDVGERSSSPSEVKDSDAKNVMDETNKTDGIEPADPEPTEAAASPAPDAAVASPATDAEAPQAPRPEPVWARPAVSDPWGQPTDQDRTVEVASDQSDQSDPAGSRGPSDAAAAPETAAEVTPDRSVPAGVTQPVPAAQQAESYAPPGYQPGPQYPQYTAPAGFGSPHGPEPVEAIGTAEAAPAGPAPWYVDATQPPPPGSFGSGQPGGSGQTGSIGQPTGEFDPSGQPYGGSGWPPPEPFAAGGTGGRKKRRAAGAVLLVGVCLLTGAIGGVAGSALRDGATDSAGRNPTISLPAPAPVNASAGTSAVTAVAAAVLPSVVSINVKTADGAGTGSGFVINAANGYILTNNHVVTAGGSAPATSIEVVFQDGTQVPGKVVGLDGSYDLAVVKVAAKGLRELELGDSDAVRVGDPVVAIGAPLGLQGTVTTGIVSALNRPVAAGEGNKPAFINAIQTDAAINPGNSGGPLVNSSGQVIAVNSAIARSPGSTGTSSGNIGLGFAIPSNQARRTAEQLIRTGKAEHPIIGVSLDSSYTGRGVKVIEQPSSGGGAPVTKDGPADKAGIKAGDVILKIDGRPVTEPDELIVAIRAQTPGKTITLTVLRGNSQSEVRVKLSASTD